MPLSGQASGTSKCPFLAAEMGQNSGVVRQASIQLQEDVQEVRTVQKGKQEVKPAGVICLLVLIQKHHRLFITG